MIHDCIDLHTHSNASDGSDSPREVVRKAAAAGLNVIALTDHDTLDGLDEAEDEAQKQGIVFVRGCEISTATPWGEAHFLGLWIPHDTAAVKRLENALADIRQKRLERNLGIADRLRALGFGVSYEQAAELARRLMDDGMSASSAAKEAASVTGIKKSDIYRLLQQ